MTTSLKVILSAVAVAMLVASPASAKSRHHGYPFFGAYGAYGPYGYYGSRGPYTPNAPSRPYGRSYDFQDGGGNKG